MDKTKSLAATHNPIAEAIDLLGGDSVVARLINVRPWAVSKWRKNIPANRVLWLAEKTGWKKTPHDLRPSLYPNPDDGLPAEVRGKSQQPTTATAALTQQQEVA